MDHAVDMRGVTKRYGSVLANDGIDLSVAKGELHAIVGENGAGKSTLMHILCGLIRSDAGKVRVDGRLLPRGDPRTALGAGVGLVAQHFSLVPTLTAWENVVLGQEPTRWHCLDRRRGVEQTAELAERLGVALSPDRPVGDLPLGTRQTIEIIKALYRRAHILVLDEPTSALSPFEANRLFDIVTRLRESGTTILLVTHRIREVQAHATRATVLRRGRSVRTFERGDIDQDALVRAIVGDEDDSATRALDVPRERARDSGPARCSEEPLLEVEDLEVSAEGGVAVNGLSLAVHRGEIVGVAGVVGNGQEEFVRAISGQIPVGAGRVVLDGRDVTRWSIGQRRAAGLASIPEDRDREGLIPPFALQENLILGDQGRYAGLAGLRMKTVEAHSQDLMRRFDIRSTGPFQVATHLSGGNRQKVVVARELSRGPVIVLAVGPTRGLDLRAAEFVREQLQAVRARGDAVLLVSTDLEELMALCDRIAVIYRGRITGMLGRNAFSEEALGRMMTGAA